MDTVTAAPKIGLTYLKICNRVGNVTCQYFVAAQVIIFRIFEIKIHYIRVFYSSLQQCEMVLKHELLMLQENNYRY